MATPETATGDVLPPPEPGQLVSLRRRPAIVKDAKPHRSREGVQTLVTVEYLDGHQYPATDTVVWEIEAGTRRLPHAGWPNLADPTYSPAQPELYDAYVDSVRWTSLQSIQDLLGEGQGLPLVSPWSAALQVEDYQLTPLMRALSMPRVSLLLADDVGLGKTIQAGLIATELIIRRHIRRILIVCPASLQVQWQEELKDKFHLDFVVMDADEVRRTQRELGTDVNPWSVHSRIITSMDYLRQDPIYESFRAAAERRQSEATSTFLPWDLLVVDEAHNAAPQSLTGGSLRSQMLRRLTEWFEHKIFLTATPHNGSRVTFTGLLETLDPVRFQQKADDLTESDKRQLDVVMVRRLKREIDEVSSVRRFPERSVAGVVVHMTAHERALFDALRKYRAGALEDLEKRGSREKAMGGFIFSLLTKRLLSSPYAFATTWWSHVQGEGKADDEAIARAIDSAETDLADDTEKDARERLAASEGGSWLFGKAPQLRRPADEVSKALRATGWTEEATRKGPAAGVAFDDGKWNALLAHIRDGISKTPPNTAIIGPPTRPSETERLILFTEYKDTQQYLTTRLAHAGYDDLLVRSLFGGMSRKDRDEVKEAFNDPESPFRILVATDAASEGLNLQRLCRYVSHYEIPWNPMRLEQRNGRVDRHGQARDVTVFHYSSAEDADQQFLARVMTKVHAVRNDIGSVGNVIDETVATYFWGRGTTQETLEEYVDKAREQDRSKNDFQGLRRASQEDFHTAMHRFDAASRKHHLSTEAIRNVFASYLNLHRARLEPLTQRGFREYKIEKAGGELRQLLLRHFGDATQALPTLVFDPKAYETDNHGRPLYRPVKGTRLVRLGNPVMLAATSYFRRAMWGQESNVPRWTMLGYAPEFGHDAILEFQYLVTARNELQEVVHSELGTWWALATPQGLKLLDEAPPTKGVHSLPNTTMGKWWKELQPGGRLRPAWQQIGGLDALKKELAEKERKRLQATLDETKNTVATKLRDELKRRLDEMKAERGEARRKKLQEMLKKAAAEKAQLTFDPAENARRQREYEEIARKLDERTLDTYERNQAELERRLKADYERYVETIMPHRHALSKTIEVTEVGIRMYVPDVGGGA